MAYSITRDTILLCGPRLNSAASGALSGVVGMSLGDSATVEAIAAPAHSASLKSERSGKERDFVTALSRGLELLRCFTREDSLLGNQELAAKTGLPKATVSRLTFTLTQLGCLRRQSQSGKYMLDVGVLACAYQMLSNLVVRSLAHPFIEDLAAETGTAVALAARDRGQMVYIDRQCPCACPSIRRRARSGARSGSTCRCTPAPPGAPVWPRRQSRSGICYSTGYASS